MYHSLNNENCHVSVLIGLKKAFHVVNHKVLIDKISFYSFRGIPNNLMENYLSDRTQYVQLGSVNSINIGVLQSIILGPMLFLFTLMTS